MIIAINSYKEYIDNSLYYRSLIKRNHKIFQIYYKKKSPKKIKSKSGLILMWLSIMPKIIYHASKLKNTTYVLGLHFPFFLVAMFFKNIDENVIIDNFYVHKMGQNRSFQKFLSFLLKGKKYQFIVQSDAEVDYFKKLAPSLQIKYIPYCMGKIHISSEVMSPSDLPSNYVFSGGYTNRDYDLVLQAAKQYPELDFVIVMSRLNIINQDIPNNVIIYKDLKPNLFNLLLSKSACVIIPLKDHVGSSGQMVCLAAMQLGKPIIYSDNSSINQYFLNDNGIPYQLNNLNSLTNAIKKYLLMASDELQATKVIQIKTFNENFTIKIRIQLIMELLFRTLDVDLS